MSTLASPDRDIILGSRSPRRLELLRLLIASERIQIIVPADEREAGFDGLTISEQISTQLANIARFKNEQVFHEVGDRTFGAILTADTIVIVTDSEGQQRVLGKPDGEDWQAKTRGWFQEYYSARSHFVATGICLRTAGGTLFEQQVFSTVQFKPVDASTLDWYLRTGEPLGKAGGYGLQGAGGIFIDAVIGSPSNVIGLPVAETWNALHSARLL